MRRMDESNKPWIDKQFGTWEINLHYGYDAQVNICANQKVVIDKLYGPLCAVNVRVFLQYDKESQGEWVLEYQDVKTRKWIEKCRFDCQENWPESEA